MYEIQFKGKKFSNPDSTFFVDEDGYLCYHYGEGIDYCHDDDYRVVRKSGIKDKNRVEICEGDIVSYFRYNKKEYGDVNYNVRYENGSFALEYSEDDKLKHYYYFHELNFPEELELIN